MLSIQPTNDKQLIDDLSQRIFGKPYDAGVGFVLYNDDQPIGVAAISATDDIAIIKDIGIVPQERGKGYGDFLTRALMDNLSRVVRRIIVDADCNYFLKFGFECNGGKMEIDSKDIVFPHTCCHKS